MRIRIIPILMVSLMIVGTIHSGVVSPYTVDPSYKSVDWNTEGKWIDRDYYACNNKQRPFLDGEEKALWAAGKYSCTKSLSKGGYLGIKGYERCVGCQRTCSLNEVSNLDACDIEAIPTVKHNVAKAVGWVIYDTVADQMSGLERRRMIEPITMAVIAGTAMTFGRSIYQATQDPNKVLWGVVEDINERFDQMKECLGQEISKSDAQDHVDDMDKCFNQYDNALDTEDLELRLDRTFGTWEEFNDVVNSKFDNLNEDATYFRNLLMPAQDFAALYALLSADLLAALRVADHKDYDMHLDNTLDDFKRLRTWAYTAEAVIVEDMWKELHELPCRNGDYIEKQMREWKNTFEEGNIDPIEQYIAQFDKLKSMVLSGDVCENLDESAKVVHVLSTDHPHTDYGKYFNFDEVEVDAIFGANVDWNGWAAHMYNERTGITEKIKLWNAEAGLETCVPMKTIKVLSVREDGKYFNFNEDDGDAIWGDTKWHDHGLRVYNRRKNAMFNVRVWRPKDGSAHGRSDTGAGKGDWKVGDVLYYNKASGTQKHTSPCVSGECTKNSYGVWKCPSRCASGSRMVDGKCIAGDGHGRREDVTLASEGNWEVGDVLIYRRGGSYTTCGDEYECIQGTCQSSYTPIDDSSRQCSTRPTVKVLSVDHSKFEDGKYFNFDIAQMDAVMGEGNWEKIALPAYNQRTGRVVNVYMWRADGNGDSVGDGHGRFAYGESGTLDWQIGDELAFNLDSSECGEGFYCVPSGDDEGSNICQHARCNADDKLPFIDVNAINKENSLTFGQYFRFDAASMDLDNLLGADWESKSHKVYNSRTKEVMKIRIWSAEGGHGRKDPKDASTTDDFHYGDRLIFNYGSADGCGDNLSCVPVGDDDDFACIAGLSFGDVVSLSE